MQSTIIITPTTNIRSGKIICADEVKKRTYDSDMDVFTFYDVVRKKTRRGNLMGVSLYDDVIVEGDTHYKIIQMLSK